MTIPKGVAVHSWSPDKEGEGFIKSYQHLQTSHVSRPQAKENPAAAAANADEEAGPEGATRAVAGEGPFQAEDESEARAGDATGIRKEAKAAERDGEQSQVHYSHCSLIGILLASDWRSFSNIHNY